MIGTVFAKTSTSTAFESIPMVADDKFLTNNGKFRVPKDTPSVSMAYCLGELVEEMRLESPHLRRYLQPYISPVDKSAVPKDLFPIPRFMDQIELEAGESLEIMVSASATTSKVKMVGMWFGDNGYSSVSSSMERTIKASCSITYNATGWVSAPLTLDETLPYGEYDIVGIKVMGAKAAFARIICNPDVDRHMIVCTQSKATYGQEMFRHGKCGSMGMFNSQEPPKLEVIGTAAGTNLDIELDLIKIS